jgi:membrane-bound metal-dependent hydrolase YbcI (DUF457 family)
MLGKEHISITLGTLLPFTIPYLLSGNSTYIEYSACFLIASVVGSLMPDADSGGKPRLYYDFGVIYDIMVPLQKFIIWSVKRFNLSNKMRLEYEVDGRHRGVMHSPIGVLISTFTISIIAIAIGFMAFQEINIVLSTLIFTGLAIGQFLHLLEDSCTVSGINWYFPFGTKKINGEIRTYRKAKSKRDVRPVLYQSLLLLVSLILLIFNTLKIVDLNDSMIQLSIIPVVVSMWLFIIFTSKSRNEFWKMDAKEVRKIERSIEIIGR